MTYVTWRWSAASFTLSSMGHNSEPVATGKSDVTTRSERMKAVPGLIELAADPKTEEQTRAWLYQALREITGQRFTHNPEAWRLWYEKHGEKLILELAAAERVPANPQ